MCIVFYFIYCFFSGHKWGSSLSLNSGEHRRLLNLPSGKTSRLTSSRRRCLKRESVKISRKEKLQNRYIDHSCNSVLITIYQLQVHRTLTNYKPLLIFVRSHLKIINTQAMREDTLCWLSFMLRKLPSSKKAEILSNKHSCLIPLLNQSLNLSVSLISLNYF